MSEKVFDRYFALHRIRNSYREKVAASSATGMDGISPRKFQSVAE